MSRLCTKPTCAEPAVAWLDVERRERRVIEQQRPTQSSLALCELHRARFGVPEGWTLESLHPATPAQTLEPEPVEHDEATEPAERPWFMAEAQPETAAGQTATHRPLLPGASRAHQSAPTLDADAGSLLRRAFHGPDRDEDLRRLDEDVAGDAVELDELEQRRHARAMVDEYGTAQLPFPPLDDEAQVAVS